MNVKSNTSKCTNEVHSPSPGRRGSSRSDRIEAVLSAAQAKLSSDNEQAQQAQQAQRAAVSKSTNKSNIAFPTSKVLDVSLIQFEKKQERPIATISDAEQQPDEATLGNSANANNAISCDAVLGLPALSPAWSVALNDEDDEDQRRRRANFVNKRKRHDHSLQAHYNAIFAEIFAAAEADDDDEAEEEEEDPQQDDNSEENTDSFHDLFIIMEADGGAEDDRESD